MSMIDYRESIQKYGITKFWVIGFVLMALMVIAVLSLLPTKEEQEMSANMSALEDGKVVQMAQAPDGTILWAKKVGDTIVYFPSGSTVVPL